MTFKVKDCWKETQYANVLEKQNKEVTWYQALSPKQTKRLHILPKIILIATKRPLKVTSTTFLFREVEQLVVYQLLSNLTIWEDFT